ncbi:MAG: hypothetical protein ABI609_16630 [Acidobacteriota bacterium]
MELSRRTVAIAVAALGLWRPLASTAAAAPNDPLRGFRTALEGSTTEQELRSTLQSVAKKLGARLSEQPARAGRRSFDLTLAAPIPARALVAAMGWKRPYAMSGDVEQTSWSLALWTGDLDDRYGPKIAVHAPHVGKWAVEPQLEKRPDGELPKLSAGPSPAYDLNSYEGRVVALEIEWWDAGWQQLESVPIPAGPGPPQAAGSRTEIRGWIDAHKGYGAPQYAESELPDMRVFVAWNIPTSGMNSTDSWVYCLHESGWQLIAASRFQPQQDQIHRVEIDDAKREVRFVGNGGEADHRVPLRNCVWENP